VAEEKKATLSGAALVAAFVALVAFGVFVWFLITQTDADETRWTRLAWVFASVEAIAFGAAGALFGSSIQRQQTVSAEERAEENAEGAVNGRALAASLIADQPGTPAGDSVLEALGPGQARDAAAVLAARHAALAKELFPSMG
jgi:hypothetical protein